MLNLPSTNPNKAHFSLVRTTSHLSSLTNIHKRFSPLDSILESWNLFSLLSLCNPTPSSTTTTTPPSSPPPPLPTTPQTTPPPPIPQLSKIHSSSPPHQTHLPSPPHSPQNNPIPPLRPRAGPKPNRTFTTFDMASLWTDLVAGVPSYYLASSLVDLSMSWWQGISTVLVANLITLVPLILTAVLLKFWRKPKRL